MSTTRTQINHGTCHQSLGQRYSLVKARLPSFTQKEHTILSCPTLALQQMEFWNSPSTLSVHHFIDVSYFSLVKFTNSLLTVFLVNVLSPLTADQKLFSKFPSVSLLFSSEKPRWCSANQRDHLARAEKANVGNQLPAAEGTFSVNIFNKFVNSQAKKREGKCSQICNALENNCLNVTYRMKRMGLELYYRYSEVWFFSLSLISLTFTCCHYRHPYTNNLIASMHSSFRQQLLQHFVGTLSEWGICTLKKENLVWKPTVLSIPVCMFSGLNIMPDTVLLHTDKKPQATF